MDRHSANKVRIFHARLLVNHLIVVPWSILRLSQAASVRTLWECVLSKRLITQTAKVISDCANLVLTPGSVFRWANCCFVMAAIVIYHLRVPF